jgi:hypothetical protein
MAGISDREPVIEELSRHFKAFGPQEFDEDADWADE